MTSPGHLASHRPKPCHRQLLHQIKCVKIQHVSQLQFSAGFQFIFRKLTAVTSRLSSAVGVSHKRLLTAAIQPASELSFALDPCSDSLLLGVSAVELDATPGLISGSPTFLFFKPTSGSGTISSWISKCIELECITFVHQFFFNSCSALLCVLPDSKTTCASCSTSVLVPNVLSQMHSFRTSAAFQLTLLLDCWCLLRAPYCRSIPRTANTQIQELQVSSIVTFQTSDTVCLHCTCWRQLQKFIGAVKLSDKNSSHPPHVQFGSIL